MRQGDLDAALNSFREAVRLKPSSIHAYNNLGNAFRKSGQLDESRSALEHAIAIDPNQAMPYTSLAQTLIKLSKLDDAAGAAEHALRIHPALTEAALTLAQIYWMQGRIIDCIGFLRGFMKTSPHNAQLASALLFWAHYDSHFSPDDLYEMAIQYSKIYQSPKLELPQSTTCSLSNGRLRIGYVSADFNHHPVAYFIDAVLENHDKKLVEVYCYYNDTKFDDITQRLVQHGHHWLNIAGHSDEELIRQIRQDGIDILVDLSGHSLGNRLSVFAGRPAPIQVAWLGYHATTGLPSIDYIIGDRFLIPPSEEHYYTERVVRLPRAYLCFSPPTDQIDPGALPASKTGKITFGCFNNTAKLTREVIACWSRLLHTLSGSHLILKYKQFDDDGVRRRYQGLFAAEGIDHTQVEFSGVSPRSEYLATYQRVDIGLDPFPFNGCTTTMESLWMGVPVISLRGDRYVGHMGETILQNMELPELIADSQEDYITKVVDLACDLPRLAMLRSELRNRLLKSPLCDGAGFTRDLESVYRGIWETRFPARTDSDPSR